MRWIPLLASLVTGCTHPQLTAAQSAQLQRPPASYGEKIYDGVVTPLGARAPAFRYERWVREVGDGTRVSTHLTWAGDVPVVLQQATQDAAGKLVAYDEVHGQRGAAFRLVDGEDLVVGPTLFGFVRTHLPQLRAGERVSFRFWDRGSVYAFALALRGDTVEMRAQDFLVGLALAPIHLRFDADAEVVMYRGPVPPLLDGKRVEAEVHYEYATTFR